MTIDKKEGAMNRIKSLMARRQFLVAAGVTSTAALAGKKLVGATDPVVQTSVAKATHGPGTDEMNGVSSKYSHILSPLKIGNAVLKNRMWRPASDATNATGKE